MSTDGEKIVLGSGKLYTTEFNGEIPTDNSIETEGNLLGLISGGATLTYKPKFYDVDDDLGLIKKTYLTEEEVTLKSGILTWNGNTLKKICNTARVTEEKGKRIVKIGGLSNQDGKQYIIRFVHEDVVDGDLRITIVGSNQAGFAFKFDKAKETVIDAEFKAAPLDKVGTMIIYEEDIPMIIEPLTVISIAGTLSGDTKITVTPLITNGNSYVYKTGITVVLPKYGDVCNVAAGYTAWDGTVDLTATTGSEIEIIEVDSSFTAIKAGKTTVNAKS